MLKSVPIQPQRARGHNDVPDGCADGHRQFLQPAMPVLSALSGRLADGSDGTSGDGDDAGFICENSSGDELLGAAARRTRAEPECGDPTRSSYLRAACCVESLRLGESNYSS